DISQGSRPMLGPYQRQNRRRRAKRRRDRHQRIRPAYDDFVDTVFWGAVVTGRVYDLSPRMQEKRNVDAPSRLIKLKKFETEETAGLISSGFFVGLLPLGWARGHENAFAA